MEMNKNDYVSFENAQWLAERGFRMGQTAFVKTKDVEVYVKSDHYGGEYGIGYRTMRPGMVIDVSWIQTQNDRNFLIPAPTVGEAADFVSRTCGKFNVVRKFNSLLKQIHYDIIYMDCIIVMETKPAATLKEAVDNLLSDDRFRRLYECDERDDDETETIYEYI